MLRLTRIAVAVSVVGLSLTATARAEEPDLYDATSFRTLNLSFHQPDWWDQLVDNKSQENGVYIEADLEVDGIVLPQVGVRFKGYSSYLFSNGDKKPFKIKLDEFVPDQELYGYDSLRLNNCWTDPTFVREPVMAKLLSDYLPVSQSNFVQLTINGELWGVYVSDQQKDRKFMAERYRAKTGNRYKMIKFGANLLYRGSNPQDYFVWYDSQADDNPAPWLDLVNLCDVLNNNPTGPGLTDDLRPLLDIDGTMWMLAGNNVFANMDSYQDWGNNFYVFHDDHHDRMEVMIHDLNMSFGTFGGGIDLEPTHNFNRNNLPLTHRMLDDKILRREYMHHVHIINQEVFRWDVVGPLVMQYQALIDAAVQADPKKLYSYQKFVDNVTRNVQADGYTVPGLQPFVEGRHNFLTNHANLSRPKVLLDTPIVSPSEPTDQDTVNITVQTSGTLAKKVELRWRVLGAFDSVTMKDDGTKGDGAAGDGVYGAVVPAQAASVIVEYMVMATADDGKFVTFEPAYGERAAHQYRVGGGIGALRINEFLARNDSGAQDESGDFDDWLEVVNVTDSPVDLGGLFLTDNLANPDQWAIPDGTVLGPGEFLQVWCDDEEFEGPHHASFRLSGNGEELALFESDGLTLIDQYVFGPQREDVSTGRLLDGDERWVSLLEPSAGVGNQPDCGVRHYDATDPDLNPVELKLVGEPRQGQSVELQIRRGPPSASALLVLGFAPEVVELPGQGVVLIQLPPPFKWHFRLDGSGSLNLPTTLPTDDSLPGLDLYLQVWCLDANGLHMSNALELDVCR